MISKTYLKHVYYALHWRFLSRTAVPKKVILIINTNMINILQLMNYKILIFQNIFLSVKINAVLLKVTWNTWNIKAFFLKLDDRTLSPMRC